MKLFDTVFDVFNDLDNLQWFGSLFVNYSRWKNNPYQTQFLYLDSDDELEDIFDEETLQPRLAYEANVTHFLDIELFKAILENQRRHNPHSTVDDYIAALNYYSEYDTFKASKADLNK